MNKLVAITGKALLLSVVFSIILSSINPLAWLPYAPKINVANAATSCSNVTTGQSNNAKVGGVELNQAATFLAEMDDITGAYFDTSLNRIVFVGKKNTSLPEFDKDDLAVAIKAVLFNKVLPAVSIEESSNSSISNALYYGGIENTRFGKVLVDADYKMKKYEFGYDENGNVVTSGVTGYRSVLNRFLDKNPTSTDSGSTRFVLRPKLVSLKKDDTNNSFVFDQVSMEVYTEPLFATSSAKFNQASSEFAQHHTDHYDEFAAETPEYADAKQLGKIVSVIKWISDRGIVSDFQWAANYSPKIVSTPSTFQTIVTPYVSGWRLSGGAEYYTANTYANDTGVSSTLKTASEAVNAPKENVHWTFTSGGQSYESVAVAAEAFSSLGSYSTSISDMSFPTAGDQDLAFTRSYTSFSTAQEGNGRGWSFMPAQLVDNRPITSMFRANCTGDTFSRRWKIAFQGPSGRESFTYNCGFVPDKPEYHSTVTSSRPDSTTIQYVVTTTDQTQYIFQELTNTSGTILPVSNYKFRLSKIKDKNGNAITYTYDSNNRLTSIADDSSHTLTLSYNSNNLLSTLTDWTNRTVTYTYDTQGNLLTVTDPRGNYTTYGYNSDFRLTSVTDKEGHVLLTNSYTSDAKLATQVDAASITKSYAYNYTDKSIIATQSATPTKTTKVTYDTRGRILTSIDSLNNSMSFTYATESAPLTVTNKRNHVTTNTYDSKGNITSVTYPNNKSVTYQYNTLNKVTQISDNRYGGSPKISTFTYDSLGNMLIATESGKTTKFTYNSAGEVLTKTNSLNHTTTYTRDSFGNPLSEKDFLNNTSTFAYDLLARLKQKTDPTSKNSYFTYDGNGNISTASNSAGTISYQYDKNNKVTRNTLQDSTHTDFTYNNSGSLTTVTDAASNVTTYNYNSYQNRTSKEDALNHTTTYEYDKMNRKTKRTTPLGKILQWQYDAEGNITKRTDENNQDTNYTYDNMNRLATITYPNSSVVTYNYDDRGNVTSIVSSAGTTSFTYDVYDRLTSVTDENSNTVSYVYDLADNLTQITYPGSKTVSYTYDNAEHLVTITDWNSQTTSYEYFENGLVKKRTLPNGIVTNYTYDNANKLSSIQHTKNSSTLAQYNYTRNSVGGITGVNESGSLYATSSAQVSGSNLTAGNNEAGVSSVSTASVSPGANKLLLLSVASRTDISTDPNQPTITGNGLTWVAVNTIVYDSTSSSRRRVTMFRAMGSSPTSGTISINFGGQTQTHIGWSLEEFSGVDTSGTNGSGAIVQSATNSTNSTTQTVTLSTFSGAENATFGAFADDGDTTPTAGSGFTLFGQADSGISLSLMTEFKNSNDTSVDISLSRSLNIGGIAVEVKAASTQSSPATVSASNITSGNNEAGVSSVSTSSVTPGSNKLLLLTVASRTDISTDPNQPTITGNGLTWVAVNTVVYDSTSSSRRRVTLYRAMGASPSTGTISINFGGQTQTHIGWSLDGFDGVDTSGTNGSGAVVQSATNATDSTSQTVTLSSFSGSNNASFGAFADDGDTTPTAGSGFSLLGQADSGLSLSAMTEFKNSNDTSVDITLSRSLNIGGIAIEIKAGTTTTSSGISFDNLSNSGEKTSVTSSTHSHTVGSSLSNSILVVGTATRDTGNTDFPITSITYNGTALTKVRHDVYDNSGSDTEQLRTELWYLVNPPSGTNNVVVNYTGTITRGVVSAISFSGVNQSNPIDAQAGGNGADLASQSTSITTNSNNALLYDISYNKTSSAITVGSGQSERINLAVNSGGDHVGASTKVIASPGSSSMQWTYTSADDYSHSILALKPAQSSSGNITYSYDVLGRLLSASDSINSFGYTYNAVGGRSSVTKNGSTTSATFNNDNQLTAFGSTSYAYDNKGNQTTSGSKTNTFDFENRLATQSASSNSFRFLYGSDGKRIGEKVNNTTTKQYVNDVSGDLERVLITRDVVNSTDNYYLYGAGLISQGGVSSSNRQYYLEDGIGNIRVLTDNSGNSVSTFTYDPYGNILSPSSPTDDFLYKGEQLNANTGLTYMRARYYDPVIGAFISRDPVDGVLMDPQTQNGYNYANDDPINLSDPSGEAVPALVAACVAAVARVVCADGDCTNEARSAQAVATTVYQEVANGAIKYVGITNNFARRAAEHMANGRIIQPLVQLESRPAARSVEQAVIENVGLSNLDNKINSISPKNPIYPESIELGNQILNKLGM